jgi:stage II sporulation protein D
MATLPEGTTVASGALLHFTLADVQAPLQIECSAPTTIVREAGLPSLTYTGSFILERSQDPSLPEHLEVIEHVELEDYVTGVVPSEMPIAWPAEALKAQAVAARTYALWEQGETARTQPEADYDFDDTVQYQAYYGIPDPSDLTAAEAATQGTKGNVLVTSDGLPIKAYFHADSGGHTEDAQVAFPGSPAEGYCLGKPEVYDPSEAPPAWSVAIALTDAGSKLSAAGLIPAKAALASLEVDETSRSGSGRATVLLGTLADGTQFAVRADDARHTLGLRSTLFTLLSTTSGLEFNGRGYGHGVGMSQWGANLLAKQKGWTFEQILDFYYTNVTLTALAR